MAQFPYLPLWTDAYLADTSHLTDAEHGIYLQLLMLIWRSPECRIPNDDEWIARRFRRSSAQVKKDIRPIIKDFCKSTGNWITQGRLKDEWERAKNISNNQSVRAKSRWNKDKMVYPSDAGPHRSGNAIHSTSTSTSTPIRKNSKNPDLNDNGNSGDNSGSLLKTETYEKAREIAPGWDIYSIEANWRKSGYATNAKKPDQAFLGFVRKHIKENKI